jgi:hypothetical protein
MFLQLYFDLFIFFKSLIKIDLLVSSRFQFSYLSNGSHFLYFSMETQKIFHLVMGSTDFRRLLLCRYSLLLLSVSATISLLLLSPFLLFVFVLVLCSRLSLNYISSFFSCPVGVLFFNFVLQYFFLFLLVDALFFFPGLL